MPATLELLTILESMLWWKFFVHNVSVKENILKKCMVPDVYNDIHFKTLFKTCSSSMLVCFLGGWFFYFFVLQKISGYCLHWIIDIVIWVTFKKGQLFSVLKISDKGQVFLFFFLIRMTSNKWLLFLATSLFTMYHIDLCCI